MPEASIVIKSTDRYSEAVKKMATVTKYSISLFLLQEKRENFLRVPILYKCNAFFCIFKILPFDL